MVFNCPGCGARYQVEETLLANGPKRTRCRKCGATITLQLPESLPASPPAVRPDSRPSRESPAAAASGEMPGAGEGKPKETGQQQEDEEDLQAKMERRRRQMEDEISGRLNKAALETLEFETLKFMADKLQAIEENPEYRPEDNAQLFSCTKCRAVFALFPDDLRQCANCPGDLPMVRGNDILRQFGMFSR